MPSGPCVVRLITRTGVETSAIFIRSLSWCHHSGNWVRQNHSSTGEAQMTTYALSRRPPRVANGIVIDTHTRRGEARRGQVEHLRLGGEHIEIVGNQHDPTRGNHHDWWCAHVLQSHDYDTRGNKAQ